jgi:DNA polymerase III delta subunit
MNIILLHGNALSAQSNKISQIKKEFEKLEVLELSAKEKDYPQIVAELLTPQLFSEKRLIILENIDEKVVDLEGLPKDESLTLVLRFSKPLHTSSSLLKKATSFGAQVILLSEKEESSIFPFLDDLAMKNTKGVYSKVDKLYEEMGFQYILTMIFYMLRRLILPAKNLPPFIVKKIETQKSNFPKERVKELYKYALETDFKIKSGLMEEKIGLTRIMQKILS